MGYGKKNTTEKVSTFSCSGAELQTLAGGTHRFAMTTEASLVSASSPLRQGMHSRATMSDRTQPSGLIVQRLGEDPIPTRAVTAAEEALPTHPAQALGTTVQTICPVKGIATGTLRKKTWLVCREKENFHQKCCTHRSLDRDATTLKHCFKTTVEKCM